MYFVDSRQFFFKEFYKGKVPVPIGVRVFAFFRISDVMSGVHPGSYTVGIGLLSQRGECDRGVV